MEKTKPSTRLMTKITCYRMFVYCCWLLTVAAPEALRAADPPPESSDSALMRFLTQDYLFGNWGGQRTRLSEQGIDLEFVYFGALAANLDGGIKEGSVLEGGLLMTLDLNSEKLVGYEGGQFHAGGLWIHNGKAFSKNYVGDLNVVSLLDFPDLWSLWELWYEQKFLDGKVSLKLGQLSIDRDFIVPEYYSSIASINFLNQTFFYPTMAFNVWDIPGFPRGDHALASTPYGAPGVRLRVDPTESVYVQAGVYDGNPDQTHAGTRINLNEAEGALAYFELGYGLNKGKEDSGPPGNYKIGGYYHTDDFYDIESVFNAFLGLEAPRTHSGNYGLYALADQMLFLEIGKEDPAQQGLAGFFRVGWAPEDRNLASLGLDGGFMYKGLIPTRDWDTVGFAASYLKISDDIRRGQELVNSFAPGTFTVADHEIVLEANYRAQLTAWWTLQPDVQYVIHPGGSAEHDNALVFLLMTTLRF
jgi:porin